MEDVRERQYEVAQRGTPTTSLTTGFLSTCFAIYGWDSNKGVAFLWHLDLHPFGLCRIVRRVRIAAGDDLSGFDLHMTSAYGLRGRILTTLLVVTWAIGWAIRTDLWWTWLLSIVTVSGGVYFILGNWIVASLYIRRTFRKGIGFRYIPFEARLRHKKLLVHVAVTVDVDTGPSDPSIESGDAARKSKELFGPTPGSRSCEGPIRATVAQEKKSLLELKRKKRPHWCAILIYAVGAGAALGFVGPLIWQLLLVHRHHLN